MTTTQILQLTRRKLLEVTTDVLPEDTLLIYANQAYQDVWKRLYVAGDVQTATVSLASGVGTLPTTFGTAYGEAIGNDRQLYTEVSINDFTKDTIERAYTIENGQLKVTNTTLANVVIKFWPKPDALVIGNTPSIDEYFHEPIIYGTMARAHEDLQDEELSIYYMGKFNTSLTERIATQSVYEETNQKGAVMFTHQSLI